MKKLNINSIQFRLVVGVIAICIFSFSITTIITMRNTRDIVRGNVETLGHQITAADAQQISIWLRGNINDIRTMSQQSVYHYGSQEEIDEEVIRMYDLRNPDYETFFYADYAGNFITDNEMRGSIEDRGYFQEVVEHGKEYAISDPIVSRATGNNIIVVAHAIMKSNRNDGIVANNIEMTTVNEIVSDTVFYNTGYGWLVNSEGMVIAHPEEGYSMEANIEDLGYNNVAELQQLISKNEPFRMVLHSNQSREEVFAYPVELSPGWFLLLSVDQSEIQSIISGNTVIILIVSMVMLLITAVIVFLISKPIVRIVKDTTDYITETLAEGNFGIAVPDYALKLKDEYGDLARGLEKMLKSIKEMFGVIINSQEKVRDSTESLAASSQEMNASLEEISATTNEFTDNAQIMNSTSQSMRESGTEISRKAGEGHQVVDNAVQQMSDISEIVNNLKEMIVILGERAQGINKVVDTIRGIAEQTNLLALNAAIEAARAGDQGRGFAVVAEEVRKLAEQSANSTTEITDMINDIQHQTNLAVSSMDEGVGKVDAGTEVVLKTGDVLKDIMESLGKIVEKIDDVSHSAEEIGATSEEVSASLEEQTATMNEVAESAAKLQELVSDLDQAVSKFTF